MSSKKNNISDEISSDNNVSDEETDEISSDNNVSDEETDEISSDNNVDNQLINYSCGYEEIVDGDNIIRGDDRKSSNKMSRYEMVRILGERVKHLTLGAKCFIKNKEDFDYETLAMEELKAKLIPFKIIRRLPNNIKEEWTIEELYIEHLFI